VGCEEEVGFDSNFFLFFDLYLSMFAHLFFSLFLSMYANATTSQCHGGDFSGGN
jgi:hypothetical protein